MSAAFVATVAAYLSHKNHHKNQKNKSISTDEDKLGLLQLPVILA